MQKICTFAQRLPKTAKTSTRGYEGVETQGIFFFLGVFEALRLCVKLTDFYQLLQNPLVSVLC
jgi:hypothetical protein